MAYPKAPGLSRSPQRSCIDQAPGKQRAGGVDQATSAVASHSHGQPQSKTGPTDPIGALYATVMLSLLSVFLFCTHLLTPVPQTETS